MLKSFRTYRFFPALAAAVLFLGMGLPLVGYACAVTPDAGATAIVASADASSTNGCEGSLGCRDASKKVPVEPSVPAALEAFDSGEQCCEVRAQRRAFSFVAPNISSGPSFLLLAASLEAEQLPRVPFYLSSFSDRGFDAVFSAPVSVRLVASVFLL